MQYCQHGCVQLEAVGTVGSVCYAVEGLYGKLNQQSHETEACMYMQRRYACNDSMQWEVSQCGSMSGMQVQKQYACNDSMQ